MGNSSSSVLTTTFFYNALKTHWDCLPCYLSYCPLLASMYLRTPPYLSLHICRCSYYSWWYPQTYPWFRKRRLDGTGRQSICTQSFYIRKNTIQAHFHPNHTRENARLKIVAITGNTYWLWRVFREDCGDITQIRGYYTMTHPRNSPNRKINRPPPPYISHNTSTHTNGHAIPDHSQ